MNEVDNDTVDNLASVINQQVRIKQANNQVIIDCLDIPRRVILSWSFLEAEQYGFTPLCTIISDRYDISFPDFGETLIEETIITNFSVGTKSFKNQMNNDVYKSECVFVYETEDNNKRLIEPLGDQVEYSLNVLSRTEEVELFIENEIFKEPIEVYRKL